MVMRGVTRRGGKNAFLLTVDLGGLNGGAGFNSQCCSGFFSFFPTAKLRYSSPSLGNGSLAGSSGCAKPFLVKKTS